jgi:hypothetical protein
MTRRRLLISSAIVLAAVATVLLAAVLLALASSGVLHTAGNAWTVQLRVAGVPLSLNVAGLVRLATLPSVVRLADSFSLNTDTGTIDFARDGKRLVARCAPCRLDHPDLAAAPVAVRAIEFSVERAGDIVTGELMIDRVKLGFNATLHRERVDLRWRIEPAPIATVYQALSAAIPEAHLARIDGSVQAQGWLALPARRGSIVLGVTDFAVAGLGTESLQHGAFKLSCAGAEARGPAVLSGEGTATWLPADQMGRYLAPAVIAAEDQRFEDHAGYDEAEVTRLLAALEYPPARGASTITQQLARTLYTGGERTVMRKLRELLYAVEMERTLGKARILELYLNTVDWGPGICGAKAAARAYFNRSPKNLTPLQAAWLAAILRNPHAAHAAQFMPRTADPERAQWVLMQMRGFSRSERVRWGRAELDFSRRARAPRERSTSLVVSR